MAKGVLRFKNMTVGKQQSELARFRVLGGPDNGVVFVVTNVRVTIGRGEENDIVLSDPKTSRKHAELTLSANMALLRDLGSSHGFAVNGAISRQSPLKSGDKVGMGETVLEYIGGAGAAANLMLVTPPVQTVRKVGGGSGLTRFIQRPTDSAGPTASPGEQNGFIEKNKRLIIGLAFLMMASAMLPEAEKKLRGSPTVYTTSADPASLTGNAANQALSVDRDSPQYKSADSYYRLGMREYYAKNYKRALDSFNTALQIDENHPLAKVYIETTKKDMNEDANEQFKLAKRELDANRYKGAKAHYEAVMRLYETDQSHENYKKADEANKDLEKRQKDMEKD